MSDFFSPSGLQLGQLKDTAAPKQVRPALAGSVPLTSLAISEAHSPTPDPHVFSARLVVCRDLFRVRNSFVHQPENKTSLQWDKTKHNGMK